jgi:hypothetical protein
MPILNQIGILSDSISQLIRLKNDLVDKAISMGICWEELAFVDKFSAIKLCCKQANCNLMAAKNIVEKYLEERS